MWPDKIYSEQYFQQCYTYIPKAFDQGEKRFTKDARLDPGFGYRSEVVICKSHLRIVQKI